LHDFYEESTFLRFDNPAKTDMAFLLKSDNESIKKSEQYCKENLPNKTGILTKLRLVVGEVASKRKRNSFAKLVYTINQEPNPIDGTLQLCINYELTKGGKVLGGRTEEEVIEKVEEITENIEFYKNSESRYHTDNYSKTKEECTIENVELELYNN
jgi:hypothetical protein